MAIFSERTSGEEPGVTLNETMSSRCVLHDYNDSGRNR